MFSCLFCPPSFTADKSAHRPQPLLHSDFQINTRPASSVPVKPLPHAPVSVPVKPAPPAPVSVPFASKPSFDTSFASWPAKNGKPTAAIVSIHGFGLHKESFAGFANQMAGRGISTYAIDVRGFGSWKDSPSENKKLDFYQTMMDLRSSIYWVKTMNPKVPIFLLGESMGGAIALQAAALFPECVSGVIASVPGSEYYGGKKAAMEVALRMVRPNSKFNVGEKLIEKATSDKRLRENWLKDPRAKLEMTPKQMAQFATFMNQSDDLAKQIETAPVLILQGGKDKLSKEDGTLRLYNALKTPNKKYVLIEHAEHLIFEKGQYDHRTAQIVESWIFEQAEKLKVEGVADPG
jgi:alpha-beta hydrolase superfamily lysophospholipase